MPPRYLGRLAVALAAALVLAAAFAAGAAEVPSISCDELNARLGERGLVILDARQPSNWTSATQKIAGAQRVDPEKVAVWAGNYAKDQVLVIYCT